MSTVVGHLHKKRTVRNLRGEVVSFVDEANGGTIIRNGQVVNHERFEEIKRIEEDKRAAASAQTVQVAAPEASIEERVAKPGKVEELETKVTGLQNDISKILELLQNNGKTS